MNESKKLSLKDNRVLFLISLLMAVVLWIYVDNENTVVIKDVPVNFSYDSGVYTSQGLDVVKCDIDRVNVTITGARSVTADITADDLIVYPKYTKVNGSGTYAFSLECLKVSNMLDFTITSLSSNNVTVTFDVMNSTQLRLQTDISGLMVDEGYILHSAQSAVDSILVTGPSDVIDSIASACAIITPTDSLNASITLPAAVKLFDADGKEVDSRYLKLSQTSVDVEITVLKVKTLPLMFTYASTIGDFNTSVISAQQSIDEITVALPQDDEAIERFQFAEIDLQTTDFDVKNTYDITLPDTWELVSDTNTVDVTLSADNIGTRTVNVSDIMLANYDSSLSVATDIIKDVVLVGDIKALESLTINDIKAICDCTGVQKSDEPQQLITDFELKYSNKIFVKGTYTITVK